MNEEAYTKTKKENRVTFFSRSKNIIEYYLPFHYAKP